MISQIFSEIEGRLFISVDGVIIFDEEDILLAEFYSQLYSWMYRECREEMFQYDSMDYEESPIIEVVIHGEKKALLSSPWGVETVKFPVEVGKIDFIKAAKVFLNDFEHEIPGINLLSYNME